MVDLLIFKLHASLAPPIHSLNVVAADVSFLAVLSVAAVSAFAVFCFRPAQRCLVGRIWRRAFYQLLA